MNALLVIGTILLVLISGFLALVVLAQKAKSDGGMGSAMGGGVAESAFGAETTNVLSKATINAAIAFFVLSFLLYLGNIYQRKHAVHTGGALPVINLPAVPKSTTSSTPAAAPAPMVTLPVAAPAPADSAKKP